MADLPILFSGPMVLALLDGRKSQTRRVLNPQPSAHVTGAGRFGASTAPGFWKNEWTWLSGDQTDIDLIEFEGQFHTKYHEGDRLYVREAWRTHRDHDPIAPRDLLTDHSRCVIVSYCADGNGYEWLGKHRQSMHMPRWASRLTLTVTEVRIQRLQDINEEDAIAEGVTPEPVRVFETPHTPPALEAKPAFRRLWDSLNAARGFGWDENPWVTATSFEVVRGNIDTLEQKP